jgi:hypothetical protein
MKIQVQNSNQQEIADSFFSTHEYSLDFEIEVIPARPEKIEGFTISASRSGSSISATIGVALDHSLRYALNRVLSWSATSEENLEVNEGPDFPIRGVIEGFYGKPWSHEQRLRAEFWRLQYEYLFPSSKGYSLAAL